MEMVLDAFNWLFSLLCSFDEVLVWISIRLQLEIKIFMDHSVRRILIFALRLLIIATIHTGFCKGRSSSSMRCIEGERQALLRFKHDLKDPLNRLASWTGKGDCCNWAGVACNNSTGHIQSLHLQSPYVDWEAETQTQSSQLAGEINPSLLQLKHLSLLDLSYNNFEGIGIPSFFGSLVSLKHLDITEAGFGGLIPHQLGNLSNLKYLSLRGLIQNEAPLRAMNLQWLSGFSMLQHLDLSGANLSKAFDWLQVINKLPSLTELHLSYCNLGHIPPLLSVNFSSIAILDLSRNKFNAQIPQWLSKTEGLHHLNLSQNSFHGPIPGFLKNMTGLRVLDISFNHFNASIPNWLHGLGELQVLSLSNNNLQGKIPNSIGNLTSLVRLDLSFNGFQGQLPTSLGNLCKLTSIDLSTNNFTQKISEISSILSGCIADGLESLYLERNSFSGHLADQLGEFKNLAYFSVRYNSISGPIPASFGWLSSLKKFDVSYNQMDGTIPQTFGQLSGLQYLGISKNSFHGVISEIHFAKLTKLEVFRAYDTSLILKVDRNWIPPFQLRVLILRSLQIGPQFPLWLQSQRSLDILGLSLTGISDTLPTWFPSISSQLSVLNLSHNQIYGELPTNCFLVGGQIIDLNSNKLGGPLPYLSPYGRMLDLSNNSFSGSLVNSLCNKMQELKSLEFLHLGQNHLSGKIPDCWRSWRSLASIDLSDNNLTGDVPISFGSLTLLQSLHLHNNILFGRFPSLQNCSKIFNVDLSGNVFVGTLPLWLGKRLPNLKILNLRSNKFHGQIPIEFCSLTSLKILDLADNSLSGTIPKCFNNLTSMITEQNSSVQISVKTSYGDALEDASVVMKGQMREYSTILQLLTTMDLSNNNLSGEIPDEVTSLHLQSLNFSGNFLTGKIPGRIGSMGLLESLDFSRNRLYGAIPPSLSNLTFLSFLNLSYNNLTGEIPLSTQLQSFGASSYIGNKLCGAPLNESCSGNNAIANPGRKYGSGQKDGTGVNGFYVSMTLGFVVGFWGVFGPLAANRGWRWRYFQFLDRLGCKYSRFIYRWIFDRF